MKILVTGGAGFIGSHLSKALIERGNSVVSLDDLSTGNAKNLEGLYGNSKFEFVHGNILNESLVSSLIAEVDSVMHFAAAVGVQKIINDPLGSLHTNLRGSEIVLGQAADCGKPTILASTSEIYGKNTETPLTENSLRVLGSPLVSRWSYSEAKAIDESMARALYDRDKWNVKIVRLFNVVGPGQSPAYGMVIPRFINAALNGLPLKVYGDGNQRRVFCHIDDAVDGIVQLWENQNGAGEAFNLGGLEEISVLDLAERIIDKTNSRSKVEFIPYKNLGPGFEDMQRRVPETSKLRDLTGWTAKKNLNQIIADTVKRTVIEKK